MPTNVRAMSTNVSLDGIGRHPLEPSELSVLTFKN